MTEDESVEMVLDLAAAGVVLLELSGSNGQDHPHRQKLQRQ
ncbi:hypothetical protein [Nocardia sp. NPDC050718]